MGKLLYLIAVLALCPSAASAQNSAPSSNCCEIIIPEQPIPVKMIALKRGFGTYVVAHEPHPRRGVELHLDKGLSRAGLWVRSVAADSFEIHFASGDRILWHTDDLPFATLAFADGTDWRSDDIRERAGIGSAHNTVLHGGADGDEFDTHGYARLVIGGGGGDTVHYGRGYGQLTIDEVDPDGPENKNILVLGNGLTPAATRVTRTRSGTILLDFGHGDTVSMTNAMERSDKAAHGMQEIHFPDGAVWKIGDMRYRLHPSVGALQITKIHSSWPVTTTSLDGGSGTRSGVEFADPKGDMEHAVALEKVATSAPLPPGVTHANLLSMINVNIDSEEKNYKSGSIDWSFKGGDSFDYLQTGQKLTLTYTFVLSDGEGGRIPFDVPVTVTGKHENYLALHGSDVTIRYTIGRGDLEIDADNMPRNVHNTLAFGPGITPDMVSIEALPYPGGWGLLASDLVDSLRLTVSGSGKILLNQALRDLSSGVQRVTFSDGTVWTYPAMVARAQIAHLPSWPYDGGTVLIGGAGPDTLDTKGLIHRVDGNGGGDTFVYNRGYGLVEIIENDWTNRVEPGWKSNTLSFGADISPADVTVHVTSVGNFELSLGHGDFVVFHGTYGGFGSESFKEYHGKFTVDLGGWFGVDAVTFADGTRWSYGDLVARQIPSNGMVHGVNGDSTLDTRGQALLVASEGHEDRIVYNRGYGPVVIAEFAPEPSPGYAHNRIIFGPGIVPNDLRVSASNQDLCIWIGGKDMVTIANALTYVSGSTKRWGIEGLQFADGASLSYEDLLARAQAPDASKSKPEQQNAAGAHDIEWPITSLYSGCLVPRTAK